MAIHFDFYESPNKVGAEEKRYHARVVNQQLVDTDYLAKEIHSGCSLTVSDVKATLVSLSEVLAKHLSNGHRIYLEGIGYFQVTLSCLENSSPKTVRADKVKVKSIAFRPDKELRGQLILADMERSRSQTHSNRLGEKQIDSVLSDYFKENTYLTRSKLERLLGLTASTAARCLLKLVEARKLKNTNTRSNPIYQPMSGYYGKEQE